MSQSIYIIDPEGLPPPATLQEMWGQIHPRLEQEAGVNPKFVELAKRLTRKFPAQEMGQDDDAQAQDSVWLSDPVQLAQANTRRVWHLDMPSDQGVEVLHEAVNQAMALNLAVLVDYLGVGFLPGKRVVPASLQAQWEIFFGEAPEPPAQKMTLPKLRKVLREMLGKRLAPHGFTWLDDYPRMPDGKKILDCQTFVRPFPGGWQAVKLSTGKTFGQFDCSVTGWGVLDEVHHVMEAAGLPVSKNYFEGDYVFSLNSTMTREERHPLVKGGDRYEVCRPDNETLNVPELNTYFDAVERHLLPVLDKARTVAGLYQVLNVNSDVPPGLSVRANAYNLEAAIVVAYLVKDPVYQELIELAFERYAKLFKKDSATRLDLDFYREKTEPYIKLRDFLSQQ